MTYAPPTLRELAAYGTAHSGVALGIVGDADHAQVGTSYHLGKDQLKPGAYSATLARDKAGLTNAASAIDLGKLEGNYKDLQVLSRWLVKQCQAKATGSRDVREVIYSPDGVGVQRYSGEDGQIHTGPGNGDASHRFHTHISYYRDSEAREKISLFAPYWEIDVGSSFAFDATTKIGTLVVKGPGHTYHLLQDATNHPIPAGLEKLAIGPVTLIDQNGKPRGPSGSNDTRTRGYLINQNAAFMIEADVTVTFPPAGGDTTHKVALAVDGKIDPSTERAI